MSGLRSAASVGSLWVWRGAPTAKRDPDRGIVVVVLSDLDGSGFQLVRDVTNGRKFKQIVTAAAGYAPADTSIGGGPAGEQRGIAHDAHAELLRVAARRGEERDALAARVLELEDRIARLVLPADPSSGGAP